MTYTPSPGDEEQVDYSIKESIYDLPEEPTVPQTQPTEPIQEVDAQGSSTGAASDTQAASTTEASTEPEQSTDTEDAPTGAEYSTANFDMTKPFEFYEAQGMTKTEWTQNRMTAMGYGTAGDVRGMGGYVGQSPLEMVSEAGAKGTADRVADTVYQLSGGKIDIPKFPKYENEGQANSS